MDSVILAEKRDSRRHSATSLSENVVAAKTSYRNVSSFIICDQKKASIKMTVLTLLLIKRKMKFSGEAILLVCMKKLKVKSRTRPRRKIERSIISYGELQSPGSVH